MSENHSPFRIFRWSLLVTAIVLVAAGIIGGGEIAAIVAILAVLEISLSFDNAVVNATVLVRMSEFWQRLFLTVGVVIAVFGMRLLFPLIIVALTAKLNVVDVVRLALHHPHQYADKLTAAHPAIAAYGGMFLLMIFLDFILEDRDIQWLGFLERPLARIGKLDQLSVLVALVVLVTTAETLAGDHARTVLAAGLLGLATYLAVNGLSEFFESTGEEGGDAEENEAGEIEAGGIHGTADDVVKGMPVKVVGKAALFLFLYLEVLDASFSFDGVVGAFAISQQIFVIAAGLGVGAMYIRSLTVFLVRKGTLSDYVFLEHGAHYAIGALAIILMITIKYDVPEVVTGLIGVGFIGLAFVSSVIRNRRIAAAGGEGDELPKPEQTVPAGR
ncbi:MAG: DUF475 domain-containing protein [Mycobacteriales bacterium]